jgi:hypothetical protein
MVRGMVVAVLLLALCLTGALAAPEAVSAGILPQVHGYDTGQGVVVPLRGVAEWLGATVEFASPQITVTLESHKAELRLGSKDATVDGKPVTLASAPRVYGSITCVPVRFVAESLGAEVTYVPERRDPLVPLSFVGLALGNRTGRIIVHGEAPDVVGRIISDLQVQVDAWDQHSKSPYGKSWIISVSRVRGDRAKVSGPAWWSGLGKDAAFSKTEMSDLDLRRLWGHWHLPPGH